MSINIDNGGPWRMVNAMYYFRFNKIRGIKDQAYSKLLDSFVFLLVFVLLVKVKRMMKSL
jgi:hypothetical protein